jgi:Fe-S cluster assembly iron-binding protein IscA
MRLWAHPQSFAEALRVSADREKVEGGCTIMLTVTKRAAALLKAAKAAEGGASDAGIRIRASKKAQVLEESGISIGFAIRDEPAPHDEELEQHGLRIFIEDVLVESLDGQTLDVREAAEGTQLVFR